MKEEKQEARKRPLGMLQVALMFVGAIMGAGFASGREIWQFFGVFGSSGKLGVLFVAVLFILLGVITAYLARTLGTNHMGEIIVPEGNPKIIEFISWFMAVILFTVLINMTAAGGALVKQAFGIPSVLGGILIGVLVVATVLGEFQRISGVFRYIMPVLFAAVVAISIAVIFIQLPATDIGEELEPSPIAGNWALAASLYISYNILAVIPIVATSSIEASSKKTAIAGAGLGGIFLGILAWIIVTALQKDMYFSQAMDMPMLAYSTRLSKGLGILYTLILFAAIYSAATSNFYGYTTKFREGPQKKKIVIVSAIAAFLMGLVGFKNIIAYMFPVEGYLGYAIIAMICVNFLYVYRKEKRRKGYRKNMKGQTAEDGYFQDFSGNDRTNLPSPLVRVTGGRGGEAILILGSERTALYDCGMACFAENLIDNIHLVLDREGRTLDYILMSHTHYDHIGALPYVLKEWPDAVVCGSRKAESVFKHPNALKTMERLGNNAKRLYLGKDSNFEITAEGMRIDRILEEGDEISLGRETVKAYETKGHTDCSMSYMVLPQKILFASESTGIPVSKMQVNTSPLKSMEDTVCSARKLNGLDFSSLILPHYGVYPQKDNRAYFERYIRAEEEERKLIEECFYRNMSEEETFQMHERRYWNENRAKEHPFAAYELNTQIVIHQVFQRLHCEENEEKV